MMAKKKTKADIDDVQGGQGYLGDMAPVTITELEEEAKELSDWKAAYKNASDEIQKRNSILMEMMKRNERTHYVCRNSALVIDITEGNPKIKVSKAKADLPVPDED